MPWQLTDLSGRCVHPGYASGPVRLPGDAEETEGGILVAVALEPAEVPFLFDRDGMILETGGVTSHAAITARELGIPALVDVEGATREFRPGELLFVDSERGKILRAQTEDGNCQLCDGEHTVESHRGKYLRVIEDMFPVVRSHSLIVPRRHVTDPAELTGPVWAELGELVNEIREELRARTGSADLNLALNVGPAAGQTIEHLHWHVLPRLRGDDEDPRGGLRRIVARPFRPYPPPH